MAWYNTDWQYRKEITIDHTQVAGDLTDFPVVIHTGSDGDLAANVQSSGDDLLFTASDGATQLSHEIESYDSSTGELWAHVKLPSVSSSSDTTLYLYYGNSETTNQESVADVWSNNFIAVYHLTESGGGTGNSEVYKDSSANSLNGDDYVSASSKDGKIARGQVFNADGDYIELPNDTAFSPNRATVSAWAKFGGEKGKEYILDGRGHQYWIKENDGTEKPLIGFRTTDNPLLQSIHTENLSGFHYVAGTFDGSGAQLYVDGVTSTFTAGSGDIATGSGVSIIGDYVGGGYTYDGAIDEARWSSVARSDAWISTTYANQDDPQSFHTIKPAESVSTPDPDPGIYGADTYGQSVYGGAITVTESGQITANSSTTSTIQTTATTVSTLTQQTATMSQPTAKGQTQPTQAVSALTAATATGDSRASPTLPTVSTTTTTDAGRAVYTPETQSNVLPDTPYAYYSFENTTDGVVDDESGNGFDGTLHGDPEPTTGVAGTTGLSFDGTEYVETFSDPVTQGQSTATFAGWFSFDAATSANNYLGIFGAHESSPPYHGWALAAESGTFRFWNDPDSWQDFDVAVPEDGVYHHVAIKRDTTAGHVTLFVDGTPESTLSVSTPNTNGLPFLIGARSENEGTMVNGRADEFRIYDRALSNTEVQALYDTPTGSPETNQWTQPVQLTAQSTTIVTPTATSVTGITPQPTPTSTTTAGEAIQTLGTTNTLAVTADATLTELASLTESLATTSGASAVAAGTETATQTTSALLDTQASGRSSQPPQSLTASTALPAQPRARATATGSRRTNAVFDTVSTGTAQSSVRVTPEALFTATGSSAGQPKQISKTSTPSFDVFEENVLRPDIQPISVTHTTPSAGTATIATDGGTKTAQTAQQTIGATSTDVTGSTKNVTQLVSADTTTSTEQQTARITHTTTSSSTGQLTTAILSQASSSVNTTDTATGTTRSGPVRDIQLTVASELTPDAVAADVLSQRGDSNMRAPAISTVTATTVPIFNSTQPVSTDISRAESQITADSTVTEITQEHSTTTEQLQAIRSISEPTTETGLAQVKPSTGEQTPTQFPSDALAYYPLDTVSDGTVTDASGNGFDGTHESGVTSIDGIGSTNGAFYDGTTESVIEDYDELNGLTEIAVSVWIQPTDGSKSDQTIIGTALEFELIFDGSGNRTPNERSIWWAIDNGTGDWDVNTPTMPPLELNTWHHLLLQQSTASGQVELWVDGEQYVSDDAIGVIKDPDGPLKIGSRGGMSFKRYTGGVDEVRIYNRALSTAEIQSLYDTPVEPDDEPTQAIFGTTVTTQQQTTTQGQSIATPTVNTVAKTAAATRGSSVEIGHTVASLTNTVSVTATAGLAQTTTRSTTSQTDATAHVATQQSLEKAISPTLSDTTPVDEQQTLTALTTHDLTPTGDALSAGTTSARTTVQTTPRVPVTTEVAFKSTITPTADGTGVGTSHITKTHQVASNTTATGSGHDHATAGTTAAVSESDQGLVTPAPQVLPTTIQQTTASSLSTEQSAAIVGLTTIATITSDGTVNERLTITRPKQFTAITDTTGIVTSEQTTAGQPSVTDSAPVAERPNILPVPHTLGALTTTTTGTITTNLISPSTLLATDTAPIRSTTQLARTATSHATDSARTFERQSTDSTAALTTTDHTEATTPDASAVATSPIPPTQEHTRSTVTTTQSLVRAVNLRERGTGITQTSTTHRAQPTATPHARATTQSTVRQPTVVTTSAQGLGTITKTQTQPTTQTAESATTAQSQADATLSQQLTASGNAYAASSTTSYTTTTSPRATDTAPVSTTPDIQIASTTSIDDLAPGLLRRVSLTDVLDTAVGTDDTPRRRPTIITGSRDAELTRGGTRIVVNENKRDVIVLDPDR